MFVIGDCLKKKNHNKQNPQRWLIHQLVEHRVFLRTLWFYKARYLLCPRVTNYADVRLSLMSGEQWYRNDQLEWKGREETNRYILTVLSSGFYFKWTSQAFCHTGLAQQEGTPGVPVQTLTFRVRGWQLSPTWPIGVQILMLLTQILTAQHMPPPHWESLSQAWKEKNQQINIDSGKGSG